MTEAQRAVLERRLLILAPTGRDAELTRTMLMEQGIRCFACTDLHHLVHEISVGAGAVLLSEEALPTAEQLYHLGDRLSRQPPWSDLPILLLAHTGADSSAVRAAIRSLGNVTLLERPVRLATLHTAVQTALRARLRQYGAREHLAEIDQVAAALRESESRLQAIFDNAAVGIAEVDATGAFALANDALCTLLGRSRAKLLAMKMSDIVHADDQGDLALSMHRLFTGQVTNFITEKRFLRQDGEAIWVKLTASLARVAGEGSAHGVAVIEDITEQKHAEEDLREADRRKDEFLATLAHELRNPLAPIRNSLHIFRMKGIRDPAVERVTKMMERQVAHMVRMVDDLLEVSRISRGKIELRKELVDLASVLRNAVDTSIPLVEKGKHKLSIDVPNEPIMLDADPVRLAQVFANLLNNAAKYTPEGGEIKVTVRVEEGMAHVCVKDNGEGIPHAMLQRVFNMFTQVSTGTRAQGGLGIGLTLAKTLVHLHGGTIQAASEGAGKGCEFTVRLPLAEYTAMPAQPARDSTVVGPLRRVLVVDDNHDAADSLGMLLQFLGADVKVVHDGPAALEAIKSFKPAVVLLDLGMPGMNGLEVARRMREDPSARAITLVALTGWGQREDRRRTSEAGFDYHLVKPADVGTLQSILSPKELEAPADATRH
ncbi:MAG TPA: ATP-binding protein [Usitatibacter sp.]|nr:ATP-binding protein [Usitatibacter sp.]